MIMNKRGDTSTNTLIAIVLGVIVIVVLAIGLTMGWSTFTPWLSKGNVDSVVQGCQVACSTQATYAFCSQPRTLTDPDKNEYKNINCNALARIPQTQSYGISTCNIDCGTNPTSCTFVETSGKVHTVISCS